MAEAEDDEREVLTSLPRSRSARRSAKRGEGDSAEAPKSPTKPASKAAVKRSERPADTAEPPVAATAEAQQPDTPEPSKAAAAEAQQPDTPEPSKAAAAKAQQPDTASGEAQQPEPPQPEVPSAGDAPPSSSDGGSAAGATKIVATAVQATVELAQIAVSVGRQVLRSAYERLPKP